jgi:peptidoglycan/LPS O-acetylase OafA/YrhL
MNRLSNGQRLHSLDGLRAGSILLVIVGHIAGTVGAPSWLTAFHNLGNFGVKIFFVISGFLITYLLLEELRCHGVICIRGFYMRRFFRIFPAFYFYIFCIVIANSFGYLELFKGDVVHAASFTMNYHHERAWALNHTWSLAVEEQFYLLWPLALLMLGVRRALLCAMVFILIAPLIRAGMWYGLDASSSAMTREFQAVGDALAAGCLLAVIHHRGWSIPIWFRTSWFILVPLSLFIIPVLLYKLDPGLFYVFGQSYVNIAAAAVIWRCISIDQGAAYRTLNNRPVIWLGTLSYSLYLWQEPFLNSWSTDWFASWPVNLVLAFTCAIFSYYFIERPFLNLKYWLSTPGQSKSINSKKPVTSKG